MRAVVFAYSNVGDRCLRVLAARGVDVSLVVTHRDDPGETLWFARVADTAEELGLPLAYADDLDPQELLARATAACPEAIFSFYFRHLLPEALLALAPGRAFNMHGSLLPRYRGRAPTNWAVLRGETETGATLHEMVARADAGCIVDQASVPILPDDTARQVFDKVTVAAEQVLWRSLPAIVAGRHPRLPNRIESGNYVPARRPEDGRIDWNRPAREVYDLIRAVAPPYPGAFTDRSGRRLIIAAARRLAPQALPTLAEAAPGLHLVGGRLYGRCGDGGCIAIRELRESARVLDAASITHLFQDTSSP